MKSAHRLRQVLNALNLSTPAGLVLAVSTRTRLHRGPRGLILGTGYRPRLPAAGAFTVGNVIFFRAEMDVVDGNPLLLEHEARHSTQYSYCLGLPFLPLYFAAALWSLIRAGDPASRNVFERRAGLHDGGYAERPLDFY
jgi:hypothetical protein